MYRAVMLRGSVVVRTDLQRRKKVQNELLKTCRSNESWQMVPKLLYASRAGYPKTNILFYKIRFYDTFKRTKTLTTVIEFVSQCYAQMTSAIIE